MLIFGLLTLKPVINLSKMVVNMTRKWSSYCWTSNWLVETSKWASRCPKTWRRVSLWSWAVTTVFKHLVVCQEHSYHFFIILIFRQIEFGNVRSHFLKKKITSLLIPTSKLYSYIPGIFLSFYSISIPSNRTINDLQTNYFMQYVFILRYFLFNNETFFLKNLGQRDLRLTVRSLLWPLCGSYYMEIYYHLFKERVTLLFELKKLHATEIN